MQGIKLKRDNKEDLLIGFKTKFELKNNAFFQNILKEYYITYKKEGARLECLCNSVDMSCKSTSYYFLANLPNNSYRHNQNCIYYEHLENLTDSEDKYKSLIFKEPVLVDFSKADKKEIENFNKKESHRKNTYNNFCSDMISESMSKSFNLKNYQIENRSNLIYPTYKDFLNTFNGLIYKNEFLPNGSIRKSLDDYYTFCYGVIDYDFITQLRVKQKDYELLLPIVKKQFDKDKQFVGYDTITINCKINLHTLIAASELVKNFNNYISAPYFFMAVYKQNKDYKKIVRFFLHPVYFDNKYIVFVDSGYERKYAQELIKKQIPFIKPILSSCFNKVNSKFVNYQKQDLKPKRAFLQFLPDFIEFKENEINIVEVSGYENIEYKNHLERKTKHYENESIKSEGLYKFKVIDGKEI